MKKNKPTMTHDEIKTLFEATAEREDGQNNISVTFERGNESLELYALDKLRGSDVATLIYYEHYADSVLTLHKTIISDIDNAGLTHRKTQEAFINLYNTITGNDEITPEGLEALGFERTTQEEWDQDIYEIDCGLNGNVTTVYVLFDRVSGQFTRVDCGDADTPITSLSQLKQLLVLLGVA